MNYFRQLDRKSRLIKVREFADKAETKKTLKILERQLKNMYELFLN